MNESGIEPRGRAVLLTSTRESLSSVIAIPREAEERELKLDTKMLVLEVGPEAWVGEREPRAKAGDVVLVSRFAGHLAVSPVDGKSYRLVNANDIFARVVA